MIWKLHETKFPFKNELDYQINPLNPVFFLITSVVSCTLYFDALIIELFKIYVVMGKNSGESTCVKGWWSVSLPCGSSE